ncbi:fimbrial protein [Enterobacter asburiae]|nr:fimbrial protein [Enterobacter asburiae]
MLVLKVARADDNVHFSGALVSEPCSLPVADTDIHVDFGSVIEKYLYQNHRTKSQPFSIHLDNCDPSIMKSVSVTFLGTADSELAGTLSMDASSNAKGIVIGFEDSNGVKLPLNEESSYSKLINGSNLLNFNAFIEAKPSAINMGTIAPGDFTATVNFLLNYQ